MRRFRTIVCCILTVVLVFVLILCVPAGSRVAAASTAEPEVTKSPVSLLPNPTGADSVKSLIEKSLEYFHSSRDYEKIADVHDPKAYIARFIMKDLLRDQDLSFSQAMERAALIYEGADALRDKDPELADAIMEEMDAMEPDEALNEYMYMIKEAFQSGEITKEDPNYEHYSQMLTDWDKGAEYVFGHYPEIMEQAEKHYIAIGLEGALDLLHEYSRLELYSGDQNRFQTLECEYRPEKTNVNLNGICSYDLGPYIEGTDAWSIDMMYYVKDAVYYLIGYSFAVGSTGG